MTQTASPTGEELVRDVLNAAESGDRLAFAALVQRMNSLERAQELVRSRGIVRMVDRIAAPGLRARGVHVRELERDAGGDGQAPADPTLYGHFAVFNEFTEVDSWFEGHFLERIAPGAFKKTIRENGASMRVLFQHGSDPQIGDKPLGSISELKEDDVGAYYEVSLLDAAYVRNEILPGLRADLYGASFRFKVVREEFNQEPEPSDHNPTGLPERTIKEAQVMEFGPVTFPAYPSATAGVRSQGDGEDEERAAVASHSTFVVDETWDGPGEEAKLSVPITGSTGKAMYAWYDSGGNDPDGDGYPDAKADWKFPHHRVTNGKPGPANVRGVRNGLARLPQATIPDSDRAGVKAHLQRHLDDFNKAGTNSANGDGAVRVTDAPSTADAAGEEHLGDTRRRSETGTSDTERRATRDFLNPEREVPPWRL